MIVSKNFIIILLAGVIAALILFHGNCKKPVKPDVIPIKEQVKTVEDNTAKEKKISDSLYKVNEKLKVDNASLVKSRAAAQSEIKRLATMLRRVNTIAGALPDTSYMEDERRQLVDDLMGNVALSDSICDATLNNLQSQVSNLEKVITVKDTLIKQHLNSFHAAMVQQDILGQYNKELKRQLKKKQVTNFLWKGAALVGGIFILKSAIN